MTTASAHSGRMAETSSTRPDHPTLPVLYDVREAAHALRLSRSLLYELISSERVRSIKQGGRRLISVQALEDFVASIEAQSSDAGSTQDQEHKIAGGRDEESTTSAGGTSSDVDVG